MARPVMTSPTPTQTMAPPAHAAPPSAAARSGWVGAALARREAGILLLATLLVVYFQTQSVQGTFLSLSNIVSLARYTGVTAIVAAGEVMVLMAGEIDLSVGYTFALAPFVMYFASQAGLPVLVGIALGLLAGVLVGALNGFVTVRCHVPSYVTTLAMLFLLSGFTLSVSGGFPVFAPGGQTGHHTLNDVFGHSAYAEILWALLIVAAMQWLLSGTRWGRRMVAAGGNALGAAAIGAVSARLRISSFMLAGALAAFAGILDGFRVAALDPLAGGMPMTFEAVAGAIIGGTALASGSGSVIGALLGVLVLSIIRSGLAVIGIDSFAFNMLLGALALVAMVLNVRAQRLREARG